MKLKYGRGEITLELDSEALDGFFESCEESGRTDEHEIVEWLETTLNSALWSYLEEHAKIRNVATHLFYELANESE